MAPHKNESSTRISLLHYSKSTSQSTCSSTVSIMTSNCPVEQQSSPMTHTIWPGMNQPSSNVHLSLMPEKEVHRYKNIFASQVLIPEVLKIFLRWGCEDKLPGETMLQFLERTKHLSMTQLRKKFGISKSGSNMLKQTHFEDFDTTLLYSLIQAACDGLADRNEPIWDSDDETRIEVLLRNLKDSRNQICHGVADGAISPDAFDKIISKVRSLVEKGGNFFKKDKTVVDAEFEKLKSMINSMNLTEKQVRLMEIECKFKKDGFEESKSHWKRYCFKEFQPFTNESFSRSEIFHPVDIYLRAKHPSGIKKISYRDLLDPWPEDEDANVTIVKGEAGSGKSTLMKTLVQQFFGLMKEEVHNLDKFNMVYYYQCRDSAVKSFEGLLKKNFPETCRKLNVEDLSDVFGSLSNIIFIDGFDESNEYSMSVINEIMQKVQTGTNCKLIITTRPYASRELEVLLDEANLSYRTCELAEISEFDKQLEFLSRYARARNSDAELLEGLIKCFKDLIAPVRKYFIYPINLVLFFHLYTSSPDAVKFWCSDGDVTKQIHCLYKTLITNTVKCKAIPNRQAMVEGVLDVIADYALECYDKRKIILSEEDFVELCRLVCRLLDRFGAMNLIDSRQILSIVFLVRNSPTNCQGEVYQFFHRTVQEMFVSRSLMPALLANKEKSFNEIVSSKIGNLNENRDLKMYEKVYVYCLMQLTGTSSKEVDCKRITELVHLMPVPEDEEGSVFLYWTKLMHCCLNHEAVANAAVVLLKSKVWRIENQFRLQSAFVFWNRLPKYQHPGKVEITLDNAVLPQNTCEFLQCLVRSGYEGELSLDLKGSFDQMEPCDEILLILKDSRLSLSKFRGCLSRKEAQEALASVASPSSALDIGLLRPEKNGLSSFLPARPQHTYATSQELILNRVPEGGKDWVLETILQLSPSSKRFYGLKLKNCRLADSDLEDLVKSLQTSGIQTKSAKKGQIFWSADRTHDEDSSVRDISLFIR